MKNKRNFVYLIILTVTVIFISPPVSALGRRHGEAKRQSIEITGRVRLIGSAPFPDLVLSDETGRDWYVRQEEKDKLSKLEQQTVKIRAAFEVEDIILADGKKVGERRILYDIVLVSRF
jgi:hypothetical protein